MALLCRIVGHLPSTDVIRNSGRIFSRCERCALDLIEAGDRWATAPRGYRIVWRPKGYRPEPDSDASEPPAPVESSPMEAPVDQRSFVERRLRRDSELPAYLGGRERRRLRDRRRGFGRKKPPRPVSAEETQAEIAVQQPELPL